MPLWTALCVGLRVGGVARGNELIFHALKTHTTSTCKLYCIVSCVQVGGSGGILVAARLRLFGLFLFSCLRTCVGGGGGEGYGQFWRDNFFPLCIYKDIL